MAKYTDGIIPKENINCARYREFPVDVQVEDVKKCEGALSHINNSLTEIKEVIEKLVSRKRELFDDELKPRHWASNEIEFVNSNLNLMLQALGAMSKNARQDVTLSKDTKQKGREHQ